MAAVTVYSAKIMDILGNTGNVVVYLPTGLTVAEIQAWSDSFTGHLDEITAGQVMSASVALALTLPVGLKDQPMAGQFVQLGGNFPFVVDSSAYRHTIRVPAVREALLSGDQIDDSGQAVIDFYSDIVTGVGNAHPSTEEGSDLIGNMVPYASFRKR